MHNKLTLTDVINIGKNKKVPVSELVKDKAEIFKLIKKGYQFDDEVLEMSRIKKIIKNECIQNVVVTHSVEKEKEYVKDTDSLKTILKTINTIDSQTEENYHSEESVSFDTPIKNEYLDEEE